MFLLCSDFKLSLATIPRQGEGCPHERSSTAPDSTIGEVGRAQDESANQGELTGL